MEFNKIREMFLKLRTCQVGIRTLMMIGHIFQHCGVHCITKGNNPSFACHYCCQSNWEHW